jgi:hypothetical protein
MDLGFLQGSFCNISFPQLLVIRLLMVISLVKDYSWFARLLTLSPLLTMALEDRVQERSRVFPPLAQGSKCTKV